MVFDKQYSNMQVRIIGLAPLQEDRDEVTGRLTGSFPLFWVHFPEAREILINAEVFNSVKNDAERRIMTISFGRECLIVQLQWRLMLQ